MKVMVSLELLVGIGIGLVIAVVLFSSQNALARLAPCGCVTNVVLGLILMAVGMVLLLMGGYGRLGG